MTDFPLAGATAAFTADRPVSPGDAFVAPIAIFGASGTANLLQWGAGAEDSEVGVWPAGPNDSLWLNYLPTDTGTLTISGTDSLLVELGVGVDAATFLVQSSGDPSIADVVIPTASNSPILIRVRSTSDAGMVEKVSLTWAWANLIPDLVLSVLSDLSQAPGTFRISVTNGIPGDTVTVTPSTGAASTYDLDDNGSVISVAFPVTTALAAGTYTVTASETGRDSSPAVNFVVVNAPLSDPIGQPDDAAPVFVGLTDGVQKWVLQDPAPGGEQYVLEINPDSMTSPYGNNVFTSDVTTAPDGQHLTWEGARKPVDWSFKGTLLTQTQYEAFEHFAGLQRRFWLIDHRARAWVVSFEFFEPIYHRVIDNDWSHDYTITAIIYKGPVTAP